MSFVDYEKKGNVVNIFLNRPERLNALSGELCRSLEVAWERFEKDPEARVAVLSGRGRVFSAGADIQEMKKTGKPGVGDWPKAMTRDPYGMTSIRKPVICAINGAALGGGLNLALGTDIRIAAESAFFGISEINLGLFGDPHLLVPQQVPLCIIMEMALTGDTVSAARALECGLVNQVVPDNELMPTAMRLAERIAQHSPVALTASKDAVRRAVELSDAVLRYGEELIEKCFASEDALEGVRAFLEKRKPVYVGR